MDYTQFEGHTPGPWLWREFGKNWCLCTAHSGALIVLDAFKKGLRVRDIARCLMIDFTPDHPDARLIAAAPDLLADNAQLRAENEQLYSALKRCVPWMGRLIADGGHLKCVAPNDAVGALEQAEAALGKGAA